MRFSDFGIEVPYGRKGDTKVFCPKCRDQRRNKGDRSLSVNVDKGTWNCHHCGWTGGLQLHKDLAHQPKKVYSKPQQPPVHVDDNALNFLHSRGLTTYTVQRFKICTTKEFMPQTGKPENALNFPYYRNDELINIKYRDGAKNFKMVKDAELIFFNLDCLSGAESVVITEGEFDTMSVHQAGRHTVVSVPNGASKGSQRLEYVDNCIDHFTDVRTIIIATDGDDPGLALRMELARRLGKARCRYVEYPEGCKDFNEVLLRHAVDRNNPTPAEISQGEEDIRNILDAAREFPIEGVYSVEDLEEELDYAYEHGFEPGEKIGYDEFDKLFSFRRGELTVVTGIPGSGKSAFLDQVLVRLSVRRKWRHAVCSFENQPTTLHISKLITCFIGKPFYRANPKAKMGRGEYEWGKFFVDDNFKFLKTSDEDVTVEGILARCEELIARYGVDSLVVDPWNCIEHNVPANMTETQFISKMLTVITNFAKAHQIHIFLVAHPTKLRKDPKTDRYEVPTLYSISGSAHFFNKTDNGLVVYRDFQTNVITVHVQKVRLYYVGKLGNADFIYDVPSGRYAPMQGGKFEEELPRYLEVNNWTFDRLGTDATKQTPPRLESTPIILF